MQTTENNKSLLVYNASAGSGKTYTLVKEYLRIILRNKNGDNFKRVLAMTFTNKAANEMKERVLDKRAE
jgi:ATP-dependent exoDNAse (exonuclease V) beta subunit